VPYERHRSFSLNDEWSLISRTILRLVRQADILDHMTGPA
jgi:hypothetical protein